MPHDSINHIDVFNHNRATWDRQAAQHCEWSQPVSPEQIAAARDVEHLDGKALADKQRRGEALVFAGHASLSGAVLRRGHMLECRPLLHTV